MEREEIVLEEENTIDVAKAIFLFFKRLFDVVVSLFALVVLSPVFIITVIAIRLDTPGKAIFTQERIGKDGKLFKMYKFRSMVQNADDELELLLRHDKKLAKEYKINKKLKNDPRITKVGKIIRKLSIDELPQILNVLKGEMSLIGNRPYLPREIPDMGEYYKDIIKTKPGITGIWQTSGRSKTTFEKRCKMEAEYSKYFSFRRDLKIFFKTFIVLFKGL